MTIDQAPRQHEPESPYTVGQQVIWVGTGRLFKKLVTIVDIRNEYLVIFGETPADGRTVYDIHDDEIGVIFGISLGQLEDRPPVADEPAQRG